MENFLYEWFGVEGRELGTPERFYTNNPQELIGLIHKAKDTFKPCYISVQPYSAPDKPCAIEKLYWDFDCPENLNAAWKDTCVFAEMLKRFYNVEPLIVYSGRKGFHVYAFLKEAVYIGQTPLAFAKQAYRELQTRLLKGLSLPTLDPQPIGDIKRMARVPFSIHEATGSLCCPVNLERKPFTPESLDAYRTLNPQLLSPIVKELKLKEKTAFQKASNLPKNVKVRPCIQAALNQPLEHKAGHLMRLAVATEFLNKGYTVDQVIPLFQNQSDFTPERSRYFVQDAKNKRYKPFKCKTIRELGFCLPNCRNKPGVEG